MNSRIAYTIISTWQAAANGSRSLMLGCVAAAKTQ